MEILLTNKTRWNSIARLKSIITFVTSVGWDPGTLREAEHCVGKGGGFAERGMIIACTPPFVSFTAIIGYSCHLSSILKGWRSANTRCKILCNLYSFCCWEEELMDQGQPNASTVSIYKWRAITFPPPPLWFVVLHLIAFQCQCPFCTTDKVQTTPIHPTKSKWCARAAQKKN